MVANLEKKQVSTPGDSRVYPPLPLHTASPESPPPPTALQKRTFLCCLKSHAWLCLMALNSCGNNP